MAHENTSVVNKNLLHTLHKKMEWEDTNLKALHILIWSFFTMAALPVNHNKNLMDTLHQSQVRLPSSRSAQPTDSHLHATSYQKLQQMFPNTKQTPKSQIHMNKYTQFFWNKHTDILRGKGPTASTTTGVPICSHAGLECILETLRSTHLIRIHLEILSFMHRF